MNNDIQRTLKVCEIFIRNNPERFQKEIKKYTSKEKILFKNISLGQFLENIIDCVTFEESVIKSALIGIDVTNIPSIKKKIK